MNGILFTVFPKMISIQRFQSFVFHKSTMKKLKELLKELGFKNNHGTVFAVILELLLAEDIIIAICQGSVTLFGYICVTLIAMMYVGLAEYNRKR